MQVMIAGSESSLWGCFLITWQFRPYPHPKQPGAKQNITMLKNSVRAVSPQKTVVYINEDLQA